MSHLRVYRTVYGIHIPDKVRFMSITDKVRYIHITDKVRYTRNTDFVYNGQKTLVPTGTLYARFTVYPSSVILIHITGKISPYYLHTFNSFCFRTVCPFLMTMDFWRSFEKNGSKRRVTLKVTKAKQQGSWEWMTSRVFLFSRLLESDWLLSF